MSIYHIFFKEGVHETVKNIPLYDVRDIKNLKDMLNSSAELYGSKAAFLSKQKEGSEYHPITYKQYKEDVDAFGTALINLGLKGKRIALIGENRYEWSVSYLGILNGTGIVVPLDRELPQNEIESLMTRSKADAIIFSGNISEKVLPLIEKLDFVKFYINMDSCEEKEKLLSFHRLLKQGHELIKDGDRSFIDAEIDNEAMSILLFTSGTTDLSKAVMLSHKNISINLMAMSSMLYIPESDIFLSVLPIHHTYECTCGFLCPIYRGATVAYCEGLRHIPKNMQESKATLMLGVPLILEAMYKRIWDQAAKKPGNVAKLKLGLKISNMLRKLNIDVTRKLFSPIHEAFGGHMRFFISGAAGIDPEIAKGFRDLGIQTVQGYGLTECSPIAALNRDVDYKDDAAGLPLPGLDVRIHAPNTDGIGEIVVKGESVMLGYYDNEEATQMVMKNGWFYTGDLGYIDTDGFVHITGRKKNVIITKNGKNVYPEEIETLLNRNPFIRESMVFGNDNTSGDTIITAVIVPEMENIEEELQSSSPAPEAVRNLIQDAIKSVNKGLVNYKHIKDIKIRETEFTKTTTKKIKRYLESNN